jgi:hypothetical protein
LLFAFCIGSPGLVWSQSSVLSTGLWYKFSVEKSGIFKLDRSTLSAAGLNLSGVDPRNIRVYGNPGGMLPQRNSISRPQDLQELSVFISGESDGTFDANDYILFYADGPDHVSFSILKDIHQVESNLYDVRNYIFVTVTPGAPGKRVGAMPTLEGTYPVVDTFEDFVFHESDMYNELKSGRDWFGERFDVTLSYSFTLDIDGIDTSRPVRFVSDVMAQSYGGSTFSVLMDNVQTLQQYVLPISTFTYAEKGRDRRDTVLVSPTGWAGKKQVELRYQYQKATTGRSVGYLDFFLFSFRRKLALYGDQTLFTSTSGLSQPVSRFRVSAPGSSMIWNITDYNNASIQTTLINGDNIEFAQTSETLQRYIIFNASGVPAAKPGGKVLNQNLHGLTVPELLIITHPDFNDEAMRLAAHREQHQGITAQVVRVNEVYNEFSSGRQDVSAIRDFVRYMYKKTPGTIKSVLFFGRSSYDYKSRVYDNTNFVATYESRNSLHPLETYASDDYFGFLEDHEGNWGESPPESHTLDIGLGRIPARKREDARFIVDKLIEYDIGKTTWGSWRSNIAFVADDGDKNEHNEQADFLADYVEANHTSYHSDKIYIDAYPQVVKPGGESVPDANQRILETINKGALIINYTGHGAEKLWAQERIFDDFVIVTLKNKQYPLFVTATCEFGRQDDPAQISSAELCMFQPSGGGIGLVSTSRPVGSYTNFELNKAFYEALFAKEEGRQINLGEVFRRTKNESISGVSNRNFSLLGDPSMLLAFPSLEAKVTAILSPDRPDTLSALAKVRVVGEIQDGTGIRVSDFDGTVSITAYDKRSQLTTLGNENAPFAYSKWSGPLFRGAASVTAGEFEIDFVVPKNIIYPSGNGKLILYAVDETESRDASGGSASVVVGESSSVPSVDDEPPSIALFMNDETFEEGGVTGSEPILIAHLEDDHGINISTYGIGNGLVALLDNEKTIALSDYYIAEKDDYKRGVVRHTLDKLEPGLHTLTLKAWDTYNNPAQATLTFRVEDGGLHIESFNNYPNPFREGTTFSFTHNRADDDLDVELTIIDLTGKVVATAQRSVEDVPYRVDFYADVDFVENLNEGLYLARIAVRSLTDGSKNEAVTKLVLLK